MRTQRAAWWFVAPALIVLGVFFFLPVLAALVMSLTDFDLYALDNFDNLACRRRSACRSARHCS